MAYGHRDVPLVLIDRDEVAEYVETDIGSNFPWALSHSQMSVSDG